MSLLTQVEQQGGVNGRAVAVRFANCTQHCVRAVTVTNNRLAPGQPVIQMRFACNCECGIPSKRRPHGACRTKCGVNQGGQVGIIQQQF
jgi:hypothetical protein